MCYVDVFFAWLTMMELQTRWMTLAASDAGRLTLQSLKPVCRFALAGGDI
jgi:hypothetical protein